MTDDRAELFRLILGRTATTAVEAILAAGFQRPKQYKREEWERCAKGPHSQAAHILDCDPRGASWHECEEWQMRDSASAGRRYCAACGRTESSTPKQKADPLAVHRATDAIASALRRAADGDGIEAPWVDVEYVDAAKIDGEVNLVDLARAAIEAALESE